MLLKNGADPNKKVGNRIPLLYIATVKKNPNLAELLCNYGADVNASIDGRTALMMASGMNQVEIVDLLIRNGADLNQQDFKGQTALFSASSSCKGFESFKLLLGKGADTTGRDKRGATLEDFLSELDLVGGLEILNRHKQSEKE